MNNYKNLEIWKLSKELANNVYAITKKFPKEELYSITDQIKRSCVSISTNIAEGSGRNSPKEFLHFLAISNGSSTELDTLLEISLDATFISREEYEFLYEKIDRIQKMNRKLQNSIRLRFKL